MAAVVRRLKPLMSLAAMAPVAFGGFGRKPEPAPVGVNAQLGLGAPAPAAAPALSAADAKAFMLARYEMEGVTDMFNRMQEACYAKCVVKHADADVTVGEGTCIDRCVVKYIQTQTKVGEKLAKLNEQQVAAQQAAQ